MKKIKYISTLMIATGLLLAIPQANATQKWQDIPAAPTILNNDYAEGVCKPALSEWRKNNCSSKTCTARWNGQWKNTFKDPWFGSRKEYAVCGSHMLERSSWKKQPLASRSMSREEKAHTCYMDEHLVTNGWEYDDVCRDHLDMDTRYLNHTTIIDSIDNKDTREVIQGLKGEASSKKMPDGRYIFVLRKYENDPDKLGLVLRRYDRSGIQPNGHYCNYRDYIYPSNYEKTHYRGNPEHVRHSQLNGGWNPVYSAGELWIKNGLITVVSNESGHFKPSKASLEAVRETLDYLSVPTANIRSYDFQKNKTELDTYKNQCAGGRAGF